ncbi:Dihydropteroate synthase [BD1-7 clade bacterium]|uniref:Dihydropteroate synthase n=1 Tax=BD1-7 clade bacterium TaxID=2029982 RepID=A0A5S9MU27_9GAMM|nr:Dihydropteroate synthase [BD1-7 clade bacterium]
MTPKLICGSRELDLSRPHVMGILNVTPDSFSDGGECHSGASVDLDKVLRRAEQMQRDGATILDVGGESTRPGAAPISVAEELDRVVPVVEVIASRLDIVISVDTSTPEVMLAAKHHGAGMLNDVRALTRPGALDAAKQCELPVCLMHMQGEPSSMQDNPSYEDPVADVVSYLQGRMAACLDVGISRQQLLIDPGFGFGKSLAHNLALLANLPAFQQLGVPTLVGMSRKSMIAHVLGGCDVSERLPASIALAVMAVERGSKIIRVHDVRATSDAVQMAIAVLDAVSSE